MERVNFREEREVGPTLHDSATFIRRNLIPFLKSCFLVAIVPMLIAGVAMGMSLSSFYADLGSGYENPNTITDPISFMKDFSLSYLIMGIALAIYFIMGIAYIKQYVNGEEYINQSSLLTELKKNFLKIFFGGILVGIIVGIGSMLCFLPGIYLAVVLIHFSAIIIIEEKGVGSSIARSFKLIKGKWWDTFLLYFVTYLINAGISFIGILPLYIVMIINMVSGIQSNDPTQITESMTMVSWMMPLYMLISLVVTFVLITVSTMRYYSLVEGKEGTGEKGEIESIGV